MSILPFKIIDCVYVFFSKHNIISMSTFSPFKYSQKKSENIDLNEHYIVEKKELDKFREDYQEKIQLIKDLMNKIDNLTRENEKLKNKNTMYNNDHFIINMTQCDW